MFTPGPWTTQPIGDESECNILGAGRELIATVSDNDANIIAAAPDLLDTMTLIAACLSASSGKMSPHMAQELYGKARAAIAKAEGRAQEGK